MLEADEGGDESDSDSDSEGSEGSQHEGANPDAMDIDGRGEGGVDWGVLDSAGGEDTQRQQALSFDIFLKGNVVSRTATSFFRSDAPASGGAPAAEGSAEEPAETAEGAAAGGATDPANGTSGALTRYRMFPLIERRRRVDGYGEVLDVGAWMRMGKAVEEESKVQNGGGPLRAEVKGGGAPGQDEKDTEEVRFWVSDITFCCIL